MKFLAFSQTKILGSSLALPAHGRAGARATSSLVAHFAKQNTKFGGGGKRRRAKIPSPQPQLKITSSVIFSGLRD